MMGASSKTCFEMLTLCKDEWIKMSIGIPKTFARGGIVHLDGVTYIFGGSLGKETYKLGSKILKWIRLADMNEEREWIVNSCLGWDGSIWVFGGHDGKTNLDSVVRYDIKEGWWIEMP